jgi:hypothetical protein
VAHNLARQVGGKAMNDSGIPVEQVLNGLKDFQRRSVDYVFRRLYQDPEPVNRFLVADEVGLGKTLVARGLIARAIDYLGSQGVKRIDVIYICSNANIARQNINRLKIPGQEGFSIASRITLLPVTIGDLSHLNFVSFTPGTSFDLRSSGGVMRERALLYYMLRKKWDLGNRAGPINLLQCGAGRDSWRSYLENFLDWNSIDSDLEQAFFNELQYHSQQSHHSGKADIRIRFEELCERFSRRWKHALWRDRGARNALIGELRFILAVSCIKALEPDLIILDEFQRFKHLLDRQNPVGQLAHQLFDYQDTTVADHEAKVILLSATPYKPYTMYREVGDDDHYKDFIDTVNFLFDSEDKTRAFRESLRAYRLELYRLGNQDGSSLHRLDRTKDQIEEALRSVMIRTERLAMTVDRNGMIESRNDRGQLHPHDLAAFKTVDRAAQALEAGDQVEYWKSAPYLLNLMDDYVLKRQFNAAINAGIAHDRLGEIVREGLNTLLSTQAIGEYRPIDPANAKLRALSEQAIEGGGWKLLWMPACLPYYQPQGVFAELAEQGLTKRLVFSAWKVVPKAISMLCSYEAERRMVSDYARREDVDYRELTRRRRQLLVFNRRDNRLTGMPIFTLLYPCLTLAQQVDPMLVGAQLAVDGRSPPNEAVYQVVHRQVGRLLEQMKIDSDFHEGATDQRWYWAAPVLLDRHFKPEPVARWLRETDEAFAWEAMVRSRSDQEDTHFSEHVDQLRLALHDPASLELGSCPDDLSHVLTKMALAAPAIVTLRAFCRQWPDIDIASSWQVLSAAAQVAMGFRTLFNLPESITLIRSPDEADDVEPDGRSGSKPYWERVLDYAIDGNLQAVMDEYVHIQHEASGIRNGASAEAVKQLAGPIHDAVSLKTISLTFDEIQVNGHEIEAEKYRIRCRYALAFGQGRNYDDGDVTRAEQVRTAFNSPFRPFILATTSIGQEGLDFHQYCHAIYHWNLPSNPVDLEQREGRIHRYKGHVIRRNLAQQYGLSGLAGRVSKLDDPWAHLFAQAEKDRDQNTDLIPYWIYEKGAFKIDRIVPALPLSREWERFEELKKALVAYRMVFGQPRQEDLLNFLRSTLSGEIKIEDILKYQIDLTPQ